MKRLLSAWLVIVLCLCSRSAYAAGEWKCSNCNTVNGGNFCGECGSPKLVWNCSGCSKENTTKYCSNCGMLREYSNGVNFLKTGEYENAAAIFESLRYGNSHILHIETYYVWGTELFECEKYQEASVVFEMAYKLFREYSKDDAALEKDYSALIDDICVLMGLSYFNFGFELYDTDGTEAVLDVYEKGFYYLTQVPASMRKTYGSFESILYAYADALQSFGLYERAIASYEECGDYLDSLEQINICEASIKEEAYVSAVALKNAGQYEEAITAFNAISNYKDSADQIIDCKYFRGIQLLEAEDDQGAFDLFMEIRPYKNSEEFISNFRFVLASETDGSDLYTYNRQGLIVELKGQGHKSVYQYDSNNMLISWREVSSAYGRDTTITYTYDESNNRVFSEQTGKFGKYSTDTRRKIVKCEYNSQNQIVKRISTTEYTGYYTKDTVYFDFINYNDEGLLIAEISLRCNKDRRGELSFILYEYNADGQCVSKKECTSMDRCDLEKYQTMETMSLPERLRFVGNNYVVEEDHSYVYENSLLVKEIVDYEGKDPRFYHDYTIEYIYDSEGYLVQKTYISEEKNEITQYTYSASLLAREVCNDSVITYKYDEFGNLIEKAYSTGSVWTYTYWPVYANE